MTSETDTPRPLPTKDEFAARLLALADGARSTSVKLDALKLFATVMGFVAKPAEPPKPVDIRPTWRVMAVPMVTSREEANTAIREQQRRLVEQQRASKPPPEPEPEPPHNRPRRRREWH